jgi:raffinose/stachyose/melibiose transport system permease protein
MKTEAFRRRLPAGAASGDPASPGTTAPRTGSAGTPTRKRTSRVAYAYLALPFAFYAVFMILPWLQTIYLSFFNWDGIGTRTWAGVTNYLNVFRIPQLRVAILHSFELMIFFCVIPILVALLLTALMTGPRRPRLAILRAIIFVPQVLPPVAIGVMWQWMYGSSGFINEVLKWVGLSSFAQPWLASFSWAFAAVGLVGSWVTTGLCLAFFVAGAQKVPTELYEAVQTDGGGLVRQFWSITLPHLRGEIVIAATVTAITALGAFDIIYVMTTGGPGTATIVPGVLVYQLGFTSFQVGQASALAVVLSALVLLVISVLRLFARERP